MNTDLFQVISHLLPFPIAIQNEQVIFIKPDLCICCADCEGVCVQGAIRVEYEIDW